MKFATYTARVKKNTTTYQFHPESALDRVPTPIDAALTIPMIGDAYVAIKKHNGSWDIPGGKIEKNESIEQAIQRETLEEAGVSINPSTMHLVGYIECSNETTPANPAYHKTNYMPVFVSFIESINRSWHAPQNEVTERRLLSFKKFVPLLKERKDNDQLYEIIKYARELLAQGETTWSFDFEQVTTGTEISESPVTQVMAFCRNTQGDYCIVKDEDEDFYSLPGGGCELDETPEQAIVREVAEEAQFDISDCQLLGTVRVKMSIANQVVSESQHLRYTCDIDSSNIEAFEPGKNGYETVERKFVPKSNLKNLVMLLNNPTGDEILKVL